MTIEKTPQLLDDKIYYPYIPKVNEIFFENYGVCTNGPFTGMDGTCACGSKSQVSKA